jgi:hypothetical protein
MESLLLLETEVAFDEQRCRADYRCSSPTALKAFTTRDAGGVDYFRSPSKTDIPETGSRDRPLCRQNRTFH